MIKGNDKPQTSVSAIEQNCDGMKEDRYYWNTEAFPFGTSDSE